jgi:hypothetical protein
VEVAEVDLAGVDGGAGVASSAARQIDQAGDLGDLGFLAVVAAVRGDGRPSATFRPTSTRAISTVSG